MPLEEYAARGKLLESQGDDLDIDLRFRLAATQAIRACGKSRPQIVAAMTDAMYPGGEAEVTVSQLNTWTAPSKSDRRFPVSHLPAFVIATDAAWLLEMIAGPTGHLVVHRANAKILELAAAVAEMNQAERLVEKLSKGMSAEHVKDLLCQLPGRRR